MNLLKEKKQVRFMMQINLIIGALCIIVFVISFSIKVWLLSIGSALCGVAQYYSFKYWKKKA